MEKFAAADNLEFIPEEGALLDKQTNTQPASAIALSKTETEATHAAPENPSRLLLLCRKGLGKIRHALHAGFLRVRAAGKGVLLRLQSRAKPQMEDIDQSGEHRSVPSREKTRGNARQAKAEEATVHPVHL